MKKRWSTVLLVVILLVGLFLLLYPTFADRWNDLHQSRAIASYAEEVAQIDQERYSELWSAAREYNRALAERRNCYALTADQRAAYGELLDIGGSGIMGYIEIPAIKCSLPIYHGTDETVLQTAAGHLEWTSLPVGGEGSHCVISGHCGLPSAKLFTNLDRLGKGDIFTLRVLDEMLTYEVDQVLVVLPDETDALHIQPGQDYCTLVTCTPYGINSHRLLVRGHRVENREEDVAPAPVDAAGIDPLMVVAAVALSVLLIFLIVVLLRRRRRSNTGGEDLASL